VSLNISSRNSITSPGSGIKYHPKKNPEAICNTIVSNSIKPMMEVTLEKGRTNLFTKKFAYENIIEDNETRFQVQFVTISIF
jgi:hypothetical protein